MHDRQISAQRKAEHKTAEPKCNAKGGGRQTIGVCMCVKAADLNNGSSGTDTHTHRHTHTLSVSLSLDLFLLPSASSELRAHLPSMMASMNVAKMTPSGG